MPRRPMTPEDLWELPRVGAPLPSPDGATLVVPVTTYDVGTNRGTTRLWLTPASATGAGAGGPTDRAVSLTASEASAGRPAFSPDGTRLAFVRMPGGEPDPDRERHHPDEPQLYLLPTSGGEAERRTDLPFGVHEPRFLPGGTRIAFVGEVYRDAPAVDATRERKAAIARDRVNAKVTEDRVYRMWDRWTTDGRVHHLFVLDLTTGALCDLTPGWTRFWSVMELTHPFDVSPDGTEIAFACSASDPPYDPVRWAAFTVKVPARIREGARVPAPRRLSRATFANAFRPRYAPDGRTIVYGMQREPDFYADRVRLVRFDRASRTHTVLTEGWDRSADGWTFGSDPRRLFLTAETQGRTGLFTLELPKANARRADLRPEELLRGGTFGPLAVSGDRIYTTRASLTTPPEVVSCDLRGRRLRVVTGFTEPVMKTIQPCARDEFIFDGHDGDPVQMLVLYPPGVKKPQEGRKSRLKLPLLHLVHGGPHGVFGDGWHWRWCAPVFAARGYAVAIVNFHGSTSWGQDFTASIHGRWGDQPYTDVMKATDLLVERGIADPRRMAVAGASYGGYLVSWIAANTDRFRCIVNHAGVCDLQAQFASDFTQGRPRALGGEIWGDIEAIDRYSPMRHARGFTSPMLVTHGEKDYRVPYTQGLQIYNVYKAMKRPARLVVYPDENHWVLSPQASLHWYGEVLAWLGRWLRARRGG